MNKIKKIILISWQAYNPHSFLLGEAFDAKIFFINDLINTRNIVWKLFFYIDYFYKSLKTIYFILTSKPNLIIVQNPTAITVIIAVLFKSISNVKVIADSHNGAFSKPWQNFPLHKWALKKADIVLIHNMQLLERLLSDKSYLGVNFRHLNSRLSSLNNKIILTPPYILVVSSFAADEPMEVLLEALRLYNKKSNSNILFRITGNYNKKPLLYNEFKNDIGLEFLGFVSNEQYKMYLSNSDAVISLSTRDDVQQFALMEAISAGVPFISNDNLTNKSLFTDKMILVEIESNKIANGIEKFYSEKNKFVENLYELKEDLKKKWEKDFLAIKCELDN